MFEGKVLTLWRSWRGPALRMADTPMLTRTPEAFLLLNILLDPFLLEGPLRPSSVFQPYIHASSVFLFTFFFITQFLLSPSTTTKKEKKVQLSQLIACRQSLLFSEPWHSPHQALENSPSVISMDQPLPPTPKQRAFLL